MKIEQSEISGSKAPDRAGIYLVDGELTVSRSMIANNMGGGVEVANNMKFTIMNSFIVGNVTRGGLNIINPRVGSVLRCNTIVDNISGNTALDAGGVLCNNAAFTFSDSLIYRNAAGPNGFQQTVGACVFSGSYVSPNDMADPNVLNFAKDTVPRDYHLTSASPALVKNVATAVCTGLVDYDGDPRPSGGACDLGADEVKE
ncbi:MAG: hypothetical protein R3B07_37380 [Polyangiaceae bacterium]